MRTFRAGAQVRTARAQGPDAQCADADGCVSVCGRRGCGAAAVRAAALAAVQTSSVSAEARRKLFDGRLFGAADTTPLLDAVFGSFALDASSVCRQNTFNTKIHSFHNTKIH